MFMANTSSEGRYPVTRSIGSMARSQLAASVTCSGHSMPGLKVTRLAAGDEDKP